MNWLKDRLKERTSWDGVMLIVVAAAILLFSPLVKVAAWAALAWGVFTLLKGEK